jgi:hypothetical protein
MIPKKGLYDMTDHDSLFAMLEKQNSKLENIEKSLTILAVQGKEISHLESSVNKLWESYDKIFGPDGVMAEIKTYQASCPG